VFLFNIADALLSVELIYYEKVLEEANPLWTHLLNNNPVAFVIAKTTIVCVGCFVLYKNKESRLAQAGAVFCFMIYFALLASFYIFIFSQR